MKALSAVSLLLASVSLSLLVFLAYRVAKLEERLATVVDRPAVVQLESPAETEVVVPREVEPEVEPPPVVPTFVHPVVGWWLADDSTVFAFHPDHTFIGVDYHGILIWGNWVELDDSVFGFRSLLHTDSYNPQYGRAVGDKMVYASSFGHGQITSRRIDEAEGMARYRVALDKLSPWIHPSSATEP